MPLDKNKVEEVLDTYFKKENFSKVRDTCFLTKRDITLEITLAYSGIWLYIQ